MSAVINTLNGFYFLHIPKTAGRSIENMLMQCDGSRVIDVSIEEKQRGLFCTPFYAEHTFTKPASGIKNFFRKEPPIEISEWHKLFKFCFVRNPYDRAYSAYKYCTQICPKFGTKCCTRKQHFGEPTPSNLTFSEFLRLPTNFNYEIKNHLHITQVEYMYGCNTKMDFIGRLETINKDLAVLADKLQINLPPIPHKNSSKKEDKPYIMSNEDKKLIEEMFKDDFIQLGYEMTSI